MRSWARRVSRAGSVLTLMAGMALGVAPAAAADMTGVSIDNEQPVVGDRLTAELQGDLASVRAAAFQWFRCADETQALCAAIDGETTATYDVAGDDAALHLAVRVTVTNLGGEQPQVHWDFTAAVKAPPTVADPTIGGQAIVGETLTATASVTGTPPPALTYEWHRCAVPAPDVCQPVGAGSAYVVTGDDRGNLLFVRATAKNEAGTAVDDSARTAAVQERPQVTSVTIAGRAVVGEKLTANATATGAPAPGLRYEWLRCAALLPPACEPIEDAGAKGYVVASADAGDRLAVRVTAANSAGDAIGESAPTDVVPEPVRFNQSGTTPTSSTNAPSSPSSRNTTPSTSFRLRYLRPFPVVRVKGIVVPGGARFSLVQVKAPRRSKVTVRCRKYNCARSRQPLRTGRIRALERFLPAGARVTIRVTKPGLIGKYVRFVIRDGSAPKRRDACLLPGKTRPVRCPPA
jgi:hypothetical protein